MSEFQRRLEANIRESLRFAVGEVQDDAVAHMVAGVNAVLNHPCAPAPQEHVAPDEDVVETVAGRIYEDAHKGMANIWAWNDRGLDDEHPGTRERYLGYARSAIAAMPAPSQHVAGILQKIAEEIRALKLHPTTSEEYDAGYIGGRNDAFAIVQEAIDNLPQPPKPEPLLTADEMKAQALRCSCHGVDDYCPCQNVPDAETRKTRATTEGQEG